jgi:hypothetical protein
VLVFFRGLTRFGFTRWLAFGVASALLCTPTTLALVHHVATDSPAESLAIASVGMLLEALGEPRRLRAWAWLAVLVFLTYQVRPAYLFLVPLLPVLALPLTWLRGSRTASETRSLPVAVRALAATLLPLLGFCGLRQAVVGHFGLVSFGGHNLIGIVGQFVTPQVLGDLPPAARPLGTAVLSLQGEGGLRRGPPAAGGPAEDPFGFEAIESNYNHTVWTVYVPTARRLFGRDVAEGNRQLYGPDALVVDRELSAFSFAVVRARPTQYLRWLKEALLVSVRRAFSCLLTGVASFVLGAGVLVLHLCYVVRRGRSVRAGVRSPRPLPDDRFFEWNSLLVLSLGYASAKMAEVVLVEPPIGRYVDAASVFLPSLLVVLLFDAIDRWRRASASLASESAKM